MLSATLSVGFFPVGNATQTTFTYYNPSNPSNNFIFRSNNTVIVASLAGVNENFTSLEVLNDITLNNSQNNFTSLWIQNPVQNNIQINAQNTLENADIRITDMLAKTIYKTNKVTVNGVYEIPISLNKGIYFITISNENGSITKKIIKN